MSISASAEYTNHWEAYWRAAGGRDAAVSGDAPGDLFDSHWRDFLTQALASGEGCLSLLDLACGAGVVLDRAIEVLGQPSAGNVRLCGLDYASSAAAAINRKAPPSGVHVYGIAASAHALPFADGVFDVVVSQFGLEYAGLEAFGEASRMLSSGGAAQFIIHYRGGGIDVECAGNAVVLEAIKQSRLFDVALDAVRGPGHQAAALKLQSIAAELSKHLEGEPLAAKQMLARLLSDTSRLVGRRQAYDLIEIVRWLEAMRAEIELYAGRMNAMTQCALDQDGVRQAIGLITSQGVIAADPLPLVAKSQSSPAAWLLKANRPG